eukprot:4965720-Pleurochrysis_carterae.AAC.2
MSDAKTSPPVLKDKLRAFLPAEWRYLFLTLFSISTHSPHSGMRSEQYGIAPDSAVVSEWVTCRGADIAQAVGRKSMANLCVHTYKAKTT